jgi:hypothetical protein
MDDPSYRAVESLMFMAFVEYVVFIGVIAAVFCMFPTRPVQ